MARLTRHELKQDEFTARFEAVREFLAENQRKIAIVAGVAVLLIGIVTGAFLYVRSRQAQAGEAFGLALATFHTLVTSSPPQNSDVPYFRTAEEKYEEARKQFLEVSERFSSFSQSQWARYYTALCQRELGKLPEAEKELDSVATVNDPELASLAKMALAGIYRQTGRDEEAEKLYQEMGDHATGAVPQATVQLALAELYQKTQPQQALDLYKQIEQDYPGTAASEVAAQRMQDLSQQPVTPGQP